MVTYFHRYQKKSSSNENIKRVWNSLEKNKHIGRIKKLLFGPN